MYPFVVVVVVVLVYLPTIFTETMYGKVIKVYQSRLEKKTCIQAGLVHMRGVQTVMRSNGLNRL